MKRRRKRKRSPYYEHVVKSLKKNPMIKNPWALAHKIEKQHDSR